MSEEKNSVFNFRDKRQRRILAACLFVLLSVLIIFFWVERSASKNSALNDGPTGNNDSAKIDENKETNKNLVRRKIDGQLVEPEQSDLKPWAVMLDNHPDARPQSGLAKANLVYEAEAEGGITRFLAIFASNEKIDEIGPVRSARPYFIDWAKEFGAIYIHCGGSPDALAKIIQEKVTDLNEFYNSLYFWRDQIRLAPHNVMTSSDKLWQYFNSLKNPSKTDFKREYKDEEPAEAGSTQDQAEIKIYFRDNFTVIWKYDIIKNNYRRFEDGKEYTDKQGNGIVAKNLIIQRAKADVMDEEKRLDMHIIGIGDAVICIDGYCQNGYWQKQSASEQTIFYYKDKNEVKYNAGTTWIEVVRPEIKIEN